MKSSSIKFVALFFTLSLLAACGGGGGSGSGGSGSNLPDLAVIAFSAPASGTAGGAYTVTGTVKNQGGVLAAGASVVIYLSPNSNVADDGGQVGMDVYMGFLNPGESWSFSIPITLPTNIATNGTNGSYYIGAVATYGDDADKSNNTRSQAITITGGTTCSPDFHEPDNSAAAAKAITLGDSEQHNHCEGTSDWLSFSATAGNVYGIIGQKVGDEASLAVSVYDKDGITRLAGTSTPWMVLSRMTWTAPSAGTYYLKVSPYSGTSSWGPNTDYRITLGDAQHPDVIVDNFWYQGAGLPGGIITVSENVRNQGFADAGGFNVSVYISANPVVTAATGTQIGTRTVSSLAAGQSSAGSWMYYSLPLLPDGTYYLAAIANPTGANETVISNNTSTVLPITIQAPAACTADTYEPDNDFSVAKPITVGAAPQSHNHCQDGSDWLKFTAEAGKKYAIRLTRAGYSSACAYLFDTDGTASLAGDCNNSPTAIDWTAPSTGTYYIQIGDAFGNERDYTVQLQLQLPDLTQTFSVGWPTVVAGGFLDVYDAVSNPGYAAAGPFEIGVYRSTDNVVDKTDTLAAVRSLATLSASSSSWDSNQAWYSVHFPVSTPTGTYYLAAIADHGNAVTELNETNNTSAPPVAVTVTAPPCAVDSYEDDDDPASAKPIAAGETQTRNTCDDNIDWASFTPSANGVYVASSTASGYLELYQSDGTTRITPHDTEFSTKLSWAATQGMKYYLKNYYGSGAYQLTVFQCTPDAFEDDETPATARAIAVGQSQSRNNCEDSHDWAKFVAVQGTTYIITATNGTNVSLDLYDTAGTSRIAYGSLGGGQQKGMSVITWTAPAGGTYYILVEPVWGFGQNKDYTLSLN